MKSLKLLKSLFIIILCVVFALAFSKVCYAIDADDDLFTDIQSEADDEEEEEEEDDDDDGFAELTTTTNRNNTTNNTVNNTSNTNNTNRSVSNNTNNTNATNRNISNTNSLANTGLSDFGGGALIVVICAISAVYSYKKISDYKKI